MLDAFGPGPVVVGPPAADLIGAHASAREALAGLRAAPGRPDAPRPVAADDLLPERALGGDPAAHRRLIDSVVAPLAAAGGELLRTLAVYIEGGGALEACARTLYVHPNTVRYRLRRIGEITGHSPTDPRDSFVLRTALVVSRLQTWSKPPNTVGLSLAGTDMPSGRGAGEACSVIALLAPGQGAQTPGMLAPWLVDDGTRGRRSPAGRTPRTWIWSAWAPPRTPRRSRTPR